MKRTIIVAIFVYGLSSSISLKLNIKNPTNLKIRNSGQLSIKGDEEYSIPIDLSFENPNKKKKNKDDDLKANNDTLIKELDSRKIIDTNLVLSTYCIKGKGIQYVLFKSCNVINKNTIYEVNCSLTGNDIISSIFDFHKDSKKKPDDIDWYILKLIGYTEINDNTLILYINDIFYNNQNTKSDLENKIINHKEENTYFQNEIKTLKNEIKDDSKNKKKNKKRIGELKNYIFKTEVEKSVAIRRDDIRKCDTAISDTNKFIKKLKEKNEDIDYKQKSKYSSIKENNKQISANTKSIKNFDNQNNQIDKQTQKYKAKLCDYLFLPKKFII